MVAIPILGASNKLQFRRNQLEYYVCELFDEIIVRPTRGLLLAFVKSECVVTEVLRKSFYDTSYSKLL